eukprot:2934268-Prymnesium_polylepis.2
MNIGGRTCRRPCSPRPRSRRHTCQGRATTTARRASPVPRRSVQRSRRRGRARRCAAAACRPRAAAVGWARVRAPPLAHAAACAGSRAVARSSPPRQGSGCARLPRPRRAQLSPGAPRLPSPGAEGGAVAAAMPRRGRRAASAPAGRFAARCRGGRGRRGWRGGRAARARAAR